MRRDLLAASSSGVLKERGGMRISQHIHFPFSSPTLIPHACVEPAAAGTSTKPVGVLLGKALSGAPAAKAEAAAALAALAARSTDRGRRRWRLAFANLDSPSSSSSPPGWNDMSDFLLLQGLNTSPNLAVSSIGIRSGEASLPTSRFSHGCATTTPHTVGIVDPRTLS